MTNEIKKSQLEITAEALKKNKAILMQRERKLKQMLAKEQSNLFKQIAPSLDFNDILSLINDQKKVEKLRNALDKVLVDIFPKIISKKEDKNATESATQ